MKTRRGRSVSPDEYGDEQNGLTAKARVAAFDYAAPAELFSVIKANRKRGPVNYQRFPTAAEAVQFAIERLGGGFLASACIEVGEQRYQSDIIRALYSSIQYPLPRVPTSAADEI